MELHSHKDTIEGAHVAHPILGVISLVSTFVLGIFSVAVEQTLNDTYLMLGIVVRLVTCGSFLLTVIIYWDKITANFKQIKKDAKDKFQRRK